MLITCVYFNHLYSLTCIFSLTDSFGLASGLPHLQQQHTNNSYIYGAQPHQKLSPYSQHSPQNRGPADYYNAMCMSQTASPSPQSNCSDTFHSDSPHSPMVINNNNNNCAKVISEHVIETHSLERS